MFTKTKIARAAAITLCTAPVFLANYAFAQSGDSPHVWGDDIMQSRDTYVGSTIPHDPTNSAYQSNSYGYVPSPNLQPFNQMDR
jgi:hypothetical protein